MFEEQECEDCGCEHTSDYPLGYDEDGTLLCADCHFERQCNGEYE